MKRKGVPRQDTSVSLFPFLAVLACTMGAMIVLLVMVLQQARVQADVISQRRSQERRSADEKESQRLRELREDCQWRREILEKQRAELLQRLASKRLELSHLEEHIRSLETKWKEIGQSVGELERLRGSKNQDLAAARAELDQLQAAVETATRQLNEAKEQAARQPRSYAVVPYQGPNGTRRRPIYVECLADSIVLQPEGFVFQAEDFNGPLGPGNPLDAALRAVREYWTRQGGSDGEPYPLLIIRPGGAIAYGVARAAMTSWDDEFGYELVGDDLQLVYPPKDPALAEILKKAVADARQRQAILAAAMPSRFSERETVGFRAERHGGLTPVGGTADEDDPWTVESGQFGSAKHPAESSAAGGSRQGGNGTAPQSGPNGGPGGPASDPGALGAHGEPLRSLASNKGRDWGLPNKTSGLTAITRPIRVLCSANQLVILPERGDELRVRVTPMRGATRDSVEPFVADLWRHIDRWGIAVSGGYWRPVLQVNVVPGGEQRFAELTTLLADSGIDMERKGP